MTDNPHPNQPGIEQVIHVQKVILLVLYHGQVFA